ncbi:hypothetical protein BC831DRAFT_455688 [Entophlyctis helioformis]|nr:hypothetical protein BC831DRAFT_455688 [Entophlyctis helioformis]
MMACGWISSEHQSSHSRTVHSRPALLFPINPTGIVLLFRCPASQVPSRRTASRHKGTKSVAGSASLVGNAGGNQSPSLPRALPATEGMVGTTLSCPSRMPSAVLWLVICLATDTIHTPCVVNGLVCRCFCGPAATVCCLVSCRPSKHRVLVFERTIAAADTRNMNPRTRSHLS